MEQQAYDMIAAVVERGDAAGFLDCVIRKTGSRYHWQNGKGAERRFDTLAEAVIAVCNELDGRRAGLSERLRFLFSCARPGVRRLRIDALRRYALGRVMPERRAMRARAHTRSGRGSRVPAVGISGATA